MWMSFRVGRAFRRSSVEKQEILTCIIRNRVPAVFLLVRAASKPSLVFQCIARFDVTVELAF